jgi:hypothetical protein
LLVESFFYLLEIIYVSFWIIYILMTGKVKREQNNLLKKQQNEPTGNVYSTDEQKRQLPAIPVQRSGREFLCLSGYAPYGTLLKVEGLKIVKAG